MYESGRARKLDESEKKKKKKDSGKGFSKKKKTTLESSHFISSQIKLNLEGGARVWDCYLTTLVKLS